MERDTLSFTNYLLGIGVAIAVFLIKEVITQAFEGYRFRKRLVSDLKIIVENYNRHLPEISKQKNNCREAFDKIESIEKQVISIAPIWSNEFTLLDEVYKNSSHLNNSVFRKVVGFYDIAGRMNEIRKGCNEILRQFVVSEKYTLVSLGYLDSCLVNMEDNCKELINQGCNALIGLSDKHWWLGIDIRHYKNIQTKL